MLNMSRYSESTFNGDAESWPLVNFRRSFDLRMAHPDVS